MSAFAGECRGAGKHSPVSISFFRFEEECTRVEEEDCRTVYDTVWEKKCEMVNVTVPQTSCEEVMDVVKETK